MSNSSYVVATFVGLLGSYEHSHEFLEGAA